MKNDTEDLFSEGKMDIDAPQPQSTIKSESRVKREHISYEEEEDEVISEIDVFLLQKLAKELCIFQFPLKPATRSFLGSTKVPAPVENIKMKPNHYKLCCELSVDKTGPHYNEDYEIETNMPAHKPFKVEMNSVKVPLRTNYAVGQFRNGQLHLTTLQNIVQFRPTYAHIDEINRALKKDEEDREEVVEEEEKSTELQPIQMQFKKRETARAIAARKKSQAKQAEEEEPWVDLQYRSSMAKESVRRADQLYCREQEREVHADLSKNQYLDYISPTPHTNYIPGSQLFSLNSLKQLPLKEQISALLINANVLHFTIACDLTTGWKDEGELIHYLEEYAWLIKGCWVVKSEHCYENPILRAARDYLLTLFYEADYVQRQIFTERAQINPEASKEMIEKLGILAYSLGWKLKLDPDTAFLERYPEVVKRQNTKWATNIDTFKNRLDAALKGSLRESNGSSANSNVSGTSASSNNASNRGSTTNSNNNNVTEAEKYGGNTVQEQVESFLNENFKKYGVCNFEFLKQLLYKRQQEKSPSNLLTAVADDLFKSTLNNLASQMHGAYFLKKINNTQLDKFRDVVLDAFSQKVALTKEDLNEAAQKKLGKEIPNASLTKIMKELAYTKNNVSYIFKQGNGE